MSVLIRFPNRRRAAEEAAAWLARMDRGLDADERLALGRWLEDPANRHELLELGALWSELDALGELAELLPEAPAPDAGRRRRRAPGRGALAVAASLVAACGLGLWLMLDPARLGFLHGDGDAGSPLAAAPVEYRTGVGERSAVDLPDGSRLELNTDSVVRVDYSDSVRGIRLDRGEGYFTVSAADPRPFRVHVGSRTVQVLGTAFNVRLHADDSLEVTVASGQVQLHGAVTEPSADAGAGEGASETVLAARQSARVEGAVTQVRRLDEQALDTMLAWQRGMLIFQGERLDAVLDEMGRYSTAQLVLADEGLGALRVGGYFRAGDVESLLIALEQNFALEVHRDGSDRVVLTAR